MTASAAALASFEESGALLRELAGVEVSTKQAERSAEALGKEIAADQRQHVEARGEVAPTMYLGMDGTGVPMRSHDLRGRVVLGDGSSWTWNTAAELFPDATQILDRFHAKEHLSQEGKIVFANAEAAKPWIEQRYEELDDGPACKLWCRRCVPMRPSTRTHRNVSTTSGTIAAACAIGSFARKACAPRPAR